MRRQPGVTFRGDDSRVRRGAAAANFAVVRPLALNLAERGGTETSIAEKRSAAALDADHLEKILEVGKIGRALMRLPCVLYPRALPVLWISCSVETLYPVAARSMMS